METNENKISNINLPQQMQSDSRQKDLTEWTSETFTIVSNVLFSQTARQ